MIELFATIICQLWFYYITRNRATFMINEIKTNFKFYPKHYSMPPKWIRKHFNLKKAEIPKFLLLRLYWAIAILAFIPATVIVCLISQLNALVAGFILTFFVAFGVLETLSSLIIFSIYKRTNNPKQKK